MKAIDFAHWRLVLAGCALGFLAACSTVPATQSGFSAQQVERLEREGFVERDGNYLLGLSNRVLFAFDSSDLRPDVKKMLTELGGSLAEVGIGGARIIGHTDSVGEAGYNLTLSERRASSVKSELVSGGLVEPRMRVVGAGESDPIASNETEQGRQQNRRVAIIVAPSDVVRLPQLEAR